jgi:DnaK suppressor protein
VNEQAAARNLEVARHQAVARLASMTAQWESIVLASDGSNADDEHDPEGSTIAFERAQLIALIAQSEEQLAAVDAAVRRLAAGHYEVCEQCGGTIAAERLAALPATRRCIACAAR